MAVNHCQVLVHEDKVKVDLTKYVQTHEFRYDDAFGEADSTARLYDASIQHLIDNFMGDGGTSTCFCFGQTASGKTFTLFGAQGGQYQQHEAEGARGGDMDAALDGLYLLAAADAFAALEALRARVGFGSGLWLTVSMFEIYGQKVRDLLGEGKELAALEDGSGQLQLVGLEAVRCDGMETFVGASNRGRLARATQATGANATSSRSHAALLLRLLGDGPAAAAVRAARVASGGAADAADCGAGSGSGSGGSNGSSSSSGDGVVLGKFSLIDLAGSERGADNDNTDKQTMMEGRQINQSLLALKEVIRAKELGRHHAPFRQSRLTQVLEESLTGARCQTVVIGCVSPAEKDTHQTMNTLRYAEGLSPHGNRRTGGSRALGAGAVQLNAAAPRRDPTMAEAEEAEAAEAAATEEATGAASGARARPYGARSARKSLDMLEDELGDGYGSDNGVDTDGGLGDGLGGGLGDCLGDAGPRAGEPPPADDVDHSGARGANGGGGGGGGSSGGGSDDDVYKGGEYGKEGSRFGC